MSGTALVLLPAAAAHAAGLQAVDDTVTIGSIEAIAPINLLANDIGPDGLPATPSTVGVVTGEVRTTHGFVRISADGTALYTPGPCSAGTDSFQYTIIDPQDTDVQSTARVTVTIGPGAAGVDAVPDRFRANAAGVAAGDLLANDCGPGPQASAGSVLVEQVSEPTKGTVLVNPSKGTFRYESNPGATGTDSFGYRITNPETPSLTDTALVTIVLPPPGAAPPPAGRLNPPPAAPPVHRLTPQEQAPAPPAQGPQLSATGAPSVVPAAVLGSVLVAAGGLLALAGRRRRA